MSKKPDTDVMVGVVEAEQVADLVDRSALKVEALPARPEDLPVEDQRRPQHQQPQRGAEDRPLGDLVDEGVPLLARRAAG